MKLVHGRSVAFGTIVLGLLLLGMLAVRWYYREWAVDRGYNPLSFSREGWRNADAERRGHMLDDLLIKHPEVDPVV